MAVKNTVFFSLYQLVTKSITLTVSIPQNKQPRNLEFIKKPINGQVGIVSESLALTDLLWQLTILCFLRLSLRKQINNADIIYTTEDITKKL